MRVSFVACLAAFVAIAGACGGRSVSGGDDYGSGGQVSAAGSRSRAGASSTGGSNTGATSSSGGRAGAGGVTGTAGTQSLGGSFAVGGMSMVGCGVCPTVGCGTGSRLVPDLDGCCFHCEPQCAGIACPTVECAPGSHPEVIAGHCCLDCVLDDCATQLSLYQAFRKQLVEKYSTSGCMGPDDCALYFEDNACGGSCGLVIPLAAVDNLDSNLRNFADQTCSPSCMWPVVPCPAPAAPSCEAGRCY